MEKSGPMFALALLLSVHPPDAQAQGGVPLVPLSSDLTGAISLDLDALAALRSVDTASVELPVGGGSTVTVDVEYFPVLAGDATIQVGDGPLEPLVDLSDTRYYAGTIVGDPRGRVLLAARATDVTGTIWTDAGAVRVAPSDPLDSGAYQVVALSGEAALTGGGEFSCDTSTTPPPEGAPPPVMPPPSGQLTARLALEMDVSYYNAPEFNGNVAAITDFAISRAAGLSILFSLSIDVAIELGHVEIITDETRTDPGKATKDNPRHRGVIANAAQIATDLADGVRGGLEFHRRLNRYRFPHSGAVVLRGLSTVQEVNMVLTTRDITPETRVESVAALRTEEGDGTVPVASQRDRIPEQLPNNHAGARQMIRTVSGVSHENALSGKPDRSVYVAVYGLLNLLFENARAQKLGGF